jgi:hypothetical protein
MSTVLTTITGMVGAKNIYKKVFKDDKKEKINQERKMGLEEQNKY